MNAQPSTPDDNTQRPAAWCGLDVAKASFEAALYLPQPHLAAPRTVASLPTQRFERSPQGVAQWLAWCDRKLAEHARAQRLELSPPLRACMEATGRYSLELAAWIQQARAAVEPAILDPLAAHFYAKSLRMRNKTDRVDAAVLAHMGYARRFAPTAELPEPYASLRRLTRQRDFLMGQLHAARLREQEMAGQGEELLEIQAVLIRELEKAVRKVDRLLGKLLAAHAELAEAVRRLRTVPGVGRLTAVVILAELGDLRRFATARQASSFAGLNPKLFESGTSVQYEAHLSKQGPARARKALYMSAMSVLRTTGPLRQYYDRLLQNGKCKLSALGALMRKQLVLMRALLVGGRDYDPQFVKTAPVLPGAPGCG